MYRLYFFFLDTEGDGTEISSRDELTTTGRLQFYGP